MAKNDPTTDEAFKLLLESDYYWSKTGESNQLKRTYRNRMLTGVGLTTDKKLEMLQKAGFVVKQVMTWQLPEEVFVFNWFLQPGYSVFGLTCF